MYINTCIAVVIVIYHTMGYYKQHNENFLFYYTSSLLLAFLSHKFQGSQINAHTVALVQVTAQSHRGRANSSRCPLVMEPWS